MKKIGNIKLKDIIHHKLNVLDMGHLTGGVNDGIMPLGDYGCDNYVCTNDKTNSSKECSIGKCKNTSCTSGS